MKTTIPQLGTEHSPQEETERTEVSKAIPFSVTSVCSCSILLLLLFTGSALADVHYVDVNSANATPPYTNWSTAATNIQDAVDAAVAGDEIVVTNGIYATGGRTGNRVTVDKPLSVRSVNGPQATTIYGGGRCVYLTNGASLSGFTLTNGFAMQGGGAYGGTLNNCALNNNSAVADFSAYGGGAYRCTLNNCTLSGNSAYAGVFPFGPSPYARGGGAYDCTLNNCTLINNLAYADNFNLSVEPNAQGGGASDCTLKNCTLRGNQVRAEPVDRERIFESGGAAYNSTLNNCTLTGNSTYGRDGRGGGASFSILKNCIVYGNSAGQDANHYFCTLNYCCTTSDPGGIGNITNAPLLVEEASGNLRLQSNSPCINAGLNTFASTGPDLDGNPRIAGGTVDIGAYEFQSPASMISYAWLQQFNLPINPSTDPADPDGDGVNNYREWLARSDPTNQFSFPPLLTLIPYGANVILTWPTNAVGFTLQSTTNLVSPAVWSTNSPAPVIIGGQNVVINPISGPQQFYRLSH